jgi:hypothetical protein
VSASPPRISVWPLALLGTVLALLTLRKSPRWSNNEQDATKPIHPQNTPTNKDRGGYVELAAISPVPPAPAHQSDANRGREDTPGWKKLAETSIAVGTLGLLVINAFLLVSSKKQLKDFEDVQRARLVVIEHTVPDGFNVEPPNSLFVTVVIKNAGQTVAEGISVNHGEGSGIDIPYGVLSVEPSPDPNGISLPPGDTKTFRLPWAYGPIDLTKNYPSDDVTISYRDIFDKSSLVFSCIAYVARKNLGWIPCHYTYKP